MSKSFILSIMPDDRKNRLMMCGNAQTQTAWIIGDDTNAQIVDLQAQKQKAIQGQLHWPQDMLDKLMQTGQMDVYAAVADLVGKSSRTVRLWANAAEKFCAAQREKYAVLSFSHFEFALRYPEQTEKILALALRQCDNNGGRPGSVDWLETQFTANGSAQAVEIITRAQDCEDDYQKSIANVFASDTASPTLTPTTEFVIYQQLGKALSLLEQLTIGIKDDSLRGVILSAVETVKLALTAVKEKH